MIMRMGIYAPIVGVGAIINTFSNFQLNELDYGCDDFFLSLSLLQLLMFLLFLN